MYIIDKNKDFYDYFSHIYGEDKAITYDRRGSSIIVDETIVDLSTRWSRGWYSDPTFVILEIGYAQYLIELSDFVFEPTPFAMKGFVSCKLELVRKFNDQKHYYQKPMSIHGVSIKRLWNTKTKRMWIASESYSEIISEIPDRAIENPILSKTGLTSILDPEEIWIELQAYISSLGNDKDISIEMTDIERAEIHGFDKKTSFRHPIK